MSHISNTTNTNKKTSRNGSLNFNRGSHRSGPQQQCSNANTAEVCSTAAYPTAAYPTAAYSTAAYPTAAYSTAAYPTAAYSTNVGSQYVGPSISVVLEAKSSTFLNEVPSVVDEGEQSLKQQFLSGCSSPLPKCVEKEVDRLVTCARNYCEKEKFKLKQYYEEELIKRKKVLLNEFRCALEQEVVFPLKQKLCEYEKEIYRLQQGKPSSMDKLALDQIQVELDAAMKEKNGLEAFMVHESQRRKSSIETILKAVGLDMEHNSVSESNLWQMSGNVAKSEPGLELITEPGPESNIAPGPSKTELGLETIAEEGQESKSQLEVGSKSQLKIPVLERSETPPPKSVADVKQAQSHHWKSLQEQFRVSMKSLEAQSMMSVQPNNLLVPVSEANFGQSNQNAQESSSPQGKNISAPFPPNTTEDIKSLLQRIREITLAFKEYKAFSQQQMDSLIADREIMVEWYNKAIEIEEENEGLRKLIEDWLVQLEAAMPDKAKGASEETRRASREAKKIIDDARRISGEAGMGYEEVKKQLGEYTESLEANRIVEDAERASGEPRTESGEAGTAPAETRKESRGSESGRSDEAEKNLLYEEAKTEPGEDRRESREAERIFEHAGMVFEETRRASGEANRGSGSGRSDGERNLPLSQSLNSLKVDEVHQCRIFSNQLETLEAQMTSLNAELEGHLKTIDDWRTILNQIVNSNKPLIYQSAGNSK